MIRLFECVFYTDIHEDLLRDLEGASLLLGALR